MVKTLYYENISPELYTEVCAFIKANPNPKVGYWIWRESLSLKNAVYHELAESTKCYGEQIDAILAKYKDKDMMFNQTAINAELARIGVVENPGVNNLLDKLSQYYY